MGRADRATAGARTRQQIAERVAADIPEGSWVNLGIGIPTLVADVDLHDREVVFQCENGLVGMGPRPSEGSELPDLINAAKKPVTIRTGGSFLNHADSFAMIRGGHLDVAVLGAFQVSRFGDLANWTTPGDGIPAVGGAMDLALGAREVWVTMSLRTREGSPKLLDECTYPLTAAGVVRRIYSDLATLELDGAGHVRLVDHVVGVRREDLCEILGMSLVD